MGERMAVVFAQGSFSCRAYMAKDESGSGLGGDSLEVGAVPGRNSRREETRCGAKLGISVEAYAETICVILTTSSVLNRRERESKVSGRGNS